LAVKWVLAEPDPGAVETLVREAGLHPLLSRLLVLRGISGPDEVRDFLACDYASLSDPAIFKGMDRAVDRIRRAVAGSEKIVIYGDYDVDGITASAVLHHTLRRLRADVATYIPDRMSEGYGLNIKALEQIKKNGAGLVISVDCGITGHKEAEAARAQGLDLVITDHHELNSRSGSKTEGAGDQDLIPHAVAVLHPLLVKEGTPEALRQRVAGLTGVGMAFKLAQALLAGQEGESELKSFLDLVTLGTIADVGAITGENRVLVKHGLELLSLNAADKRPGIEALKRVSGASGKKISVGTVGFTLAPRINAGGRLERADMALRLLTTDSPEEADELATALDAVNKERQALEESILAQARKACLGFDLAATGALVLSSQDWHAGVIGIVASRLAEEFYRPAALISVQDGVGKGSARSIPGFDLYGGLSACSDLLLGFGGHKYAAGFSIEERKIPLLRERLSSYVREAMGPAGFVRTLSIDGAVSFSELTRELVQEIEKLAPFGQGNPEPRLGARGLTVQSPRIVGAKHLKLRMKQNGGSALEAIAFNRAPLLGRQVREGARLAAVFTPRLNTWNGSSQVELEIRDVKTDR
jgi:single-stranded-DNA-specific exonuclease